MKRSWGLVASLLSSRNGCANLIHLDISDNHPVVAIFGPSSAIKIHPILHAQFDATHIPTVDGKAVVYTLSIRDPKTKLSAAAFVGISMVENSEVTSKMLRIYAKSIPKDTVFNPIITVDTNNGAIQGLVEAGFRYRCSLFHVVKRMIEHFQKSGVAADDLVIVLFKFKAALRALVYHRDRVSPKDLKYAVKIEDAVFWDSLEMLVGGARWTYLRDDSSDSWRSCGLVDAAHRDLKVLMRLSASKTCSLKDIVGSIVGIDFENMDKATISLFAFQQRERSAERKKKTKVAKCLTSFTKVGVGIYSFTEEGVGETLRSVTKMTARCSISDQDVFAALKPLDALIWNNEIKDGLQYCNMITGECTCLYSRFHIPSIDSKMLCKHVAECVVVINKT